MDSDTDDERAFLRPRLQVSKKSHVPVVEISNRIATVGFGDCGYADNDPAPMPAQEATLNGVVITPTRKKKNRKRSRNKLPNVQATNICGETKNNSNTGCDISETRVVEDQVGGFDNVNEVQVTEYLDQGGTSERIVADVSDTLHHRKIAECQTTITGDVFALNFYQESNYLVGTVLGGGCVDQLVTLQDIEACLSAVQASFACPSTRVETESCSVQTDEPRPDPVLSMLPARDRDFHGRDAREWQSVDRLMQTDVLEAQTYTHHSGHVLDPIAGKVDKGTQLECSELQTSRFGEAMTDQTVQTEFNSFMTWSSEDDSCRSMASSLSSTAQLSNASHVAHHPCYCLNPSNPSHVVCSAPSIDVGNDGENTNTELSDATGERRRLWLNVMFEYVAVPFVILRLAFLGISSILNYFCYFF